jgi:hypothetical protein
VAVGVGADIRFSRKEINMHYYPVPEEARRAGIFGPYLDYVGPFSSKGIAEQMRQALLAQARQRLAVLTNEGEQPHKNQEVDNTS